MGKGDGAVGRQLATHTLSAGLPARAGEGAASDREEASGATERVVADTAAGSSSSALLATCARRVPTQSSNPTAMSTPKRRPLTNEYKRLDNIVTLKQEIKKLHQEVKELREGERRRLDDMRSQAEAHRSELAQMSKLNNRELQKLMTELRCKERTVARLQRDMSALRTHWEKLSLMQCEEQSAAVRRTKATMPPDTGEQRGEGCSAPRSERPRKKLGGRMMDFINSQLLEDETRHRTVVFVGDDQRRTDQDILRIDIPRHTSPPRHTGKEPTYVSDGTQVEYDDVSSRLREQGVQTSSSLLAESDSTTCACCCTCRSLETGRHLPTTDTGQTLPPADTGQQHSLPDSTKPVVDLETLYAVLTEEHVGLAWQARRAVQAEAELTQAFRESERSKLCLEARITEITEEKDLLEFRLLEMEQSINKSGEMRSCESAGPRWDQLTEPDDVTDSGVMSLPTSEDDISMCESEGGSDVAKWRLLGLSRQTESPSDRTCLQETLALLGHFNNKLQPTTVRYGEGKIVATVTPFTSVEGRRESDPLEESGIFEESPPTSSRHTQTDPAHSPGDLTQEIRKLAQIRERIEESKVPSPEARELVFCRERLSTLEDRLSQYEALPQHRETRERLEREARLRNQVKRFDEAIQFMKQENTRLEEQCSELEEAENDTRLRCQKLEVKVSSLGEKKNSLKAQLELNERMMADLKETLSKEEVRKTEALQQVNRLENVVHQYEKKNFELEEREMEVRYRLQVLENTFPALMMWNMWRMLMVMQTGAAEGRERESELLMKLKAMETRLYDEKALLEESRKAELELKDKIERLENMLSAKAEEPEMSEVSDKLNRLTEEKEETDKRIKDLELREKLYRETLQQADSMFAEMENDYARQIKDKEKEIRDKEMELSETESKMRRLSKEKENSVVLQDRLHSLENELKSTKQNLNRKVQDRASLKQEEFRLKSELNMCLEENQTLRSTLDDTRMELDTERRTVKELKQLLDRLEGDNNSVQQEHESEVSRYRKQIKKLGMELMESEVTISELKEEVQTLELAIEELREELRGERERTKDERVRLEAELEERGRRLEVLEVATQSAAVSLKDELAEVQHHNLQRPVPALRKDCEERTNRTPVPHPRKIKESLQT